ncbi:MAG: methyltransferase domain-containing protein [Thermoleophilia bacterium]|nr:methyltransferase domain-containing protein [Thermoleophilia bacterium]
MPRSLSQTTKDFLTFPLRAFLLVEGDKWGLSALPSERFDYVSRNVRGYCLDVGCGKYNRFVKEFLNGEGVGIDVFKYDGLTDENIVEDLSTFPFEDETFETVTFIANLNHVPEPLRDTELSEAFRVLKPGSNIVVTMGNPVAMVMTHKVVELYDKKLGTNYDVDSERGMEEEESYYLKDTEIIERLARAGFSEIEKSYFFTQWNLNHLFVGWKR